MGENRGGGPLLGVTLRVEQGLQAIFLCFLHTRYWASWFYYTVALPTYMGPNNHGWKPLNTGANEISP